MKEDTCQTCIKRFNKIKQLDDKFFNLSGKNDSLVSSVSVDEAPGVYEETLRQHEA